MGRQPYFLLHLTVQFQRLREAQDGEARRAAKDQVCELLRAWCDGDTSTLERLTPIVYGNRDGR